MLTDNPSNMGLYHLCSFSSGKTLCFYHDLHPLADRHIWVYQCVCVASEAHTDTCIPLSLCNFRTRGTYIYILAGSKR